MKQLLRQRGCYQECWSNDTNRKAYFDYLSWILRSSTCSNQSTFNPPPSSLHPWLLKSVIVGYNEKQLGVQLSIPRWVNLRRPKQLIKHDSMHFMWWYTCGYALDILWTDAVSHFVLLVYLGPNWEEGLYHIGMAFVTGSHECSPAILWNKMR